MSANAVQRKVEALDVVAVAEPHHPIRVLVSIRTRYTPRRSPASAHSRERTDRFLRLLRLLLPRRASGHLAD